MGDVREAADARDLRGGKPGREKPLLDLLKARLENGLSDGLALALAESEVGEASRDAEMAGDVVIQSENVIVCHVIRSKNVMDIKSPRRSLSEIRVIPRKGVKIAFANTWAGEYGSLHATADSEKDERAFAARPQVLMEGNGLRR